MEDLARLVEAELLSVDVADPGRVLMRLRSRFTGEDCVVRGAGIVDFSIDSFRENNIVDLICDFGPTSTAAEVENAFLKRARDEGLKISEKVKDLVKSRTSRVMSGELRLQIWEAVYGARIFLLAEQIQFTFSEGSKSSTR